MNSNTNRQTLTFIPDYAYTQLPAQSSAAVKVLFSNFAEMAGHIRIFSKADRLEIMRKCGSGPQGDILRMLGSYSYDRNDMKKAARLFPGAI